MQRPLKSLAHLATQHSQAALKGATRLDPLNLQGLADGTGDALQRVVLPDLGIEHYPHYVRGLGYPRDLLLQHCAKTSRMRLSAKEK